MTPTEPIAIIGSACRFPGDIETPSKLWELLKTPRDLLRQIPPDRFDAEAFYHANGHHHGTSNVRHSYFIDQDPAAFDNGFFNIPASEAEAIDPQQRMLMETVYDSLCAGGQTIEGLRGSPTSVFVGVMCGDWEGMLGRDLETYPQYGATGTGRSIMSNRISYFFDWHGPCMTIDTACSSSLVAVHQAIQTLCNGESGVAIAAGANLILSPAMYVAESKLSMLSPSGRSRMWDKDVDGYARGEGIASVVLKPLGAAIRDNDNIECLIRATGVNQDGRTSGLTMPSGNAQSSLIRETYRRASLNIGDSAHWPQFFHAHGTGTAAGDPQEARAISQAFDREKRPDNNLKLYVGSIKTVIGHTEGTAGLASLLGTSLALRNGIIPPNMHFNTLNPNIEPFYQHLQVPTRCVPWPRTYPGQPRRASINSFGFGGTNAHAILEAYNPSPKPAGHLMPMSSGSSLAPPVFSPLTFSAASESSLRSIFSSYLEYLQSTNNVDLHDLAYSLHSRTSTLPYRVPITASTKEDACAQIDAILNGQMESSIGERQLVKHSPKILGIFTGQGSQWARMGAKLVEESPFVVQRLSELDKSLSELPTDQRPLWVLQDLMLAEAEVSKMSDAAISQPVCTAIQIILVDLLEFAGVKFHALVGHSSGEIGAAYAAGLISGRDAIRAAYYRGLYAHLAKSPNGKKGSMLAVGTTFEDATEFCQLEDFEGRVQIAARNSPSSTTLSGDEDAIIEAIEIFKDEDKFARQLKVDTAYHSTHVLPCAESYRKALEQLGSDRQVPTGSKWYSSVYEGDIMGSDQLGAQYWIDNMANPVLFSPAVAKAWADSGPFDIAIEVGPHPALKTPCLDIIEGITGGRPPYSGVMKRGMDDVKLFSNALGFIWTCLGPGSIDFENFERAISQNNSPRRYIKDLPKYPFDHNRKFMSLSRASGIYRDTQGAPHPLLGRRCFDRETSTLIQWRNVLKPKEIPWLTSHQIQNQVIFPATGYLSLIVEAINAYVGGSDIGLIAVRDLHIHRAMVFNDDSPEIEVLNELRIISRTDRVIAAQFSCSMGAPHERRSVMASSAEGTVEVTISAPEAEILPNIKIDDLNLSYVDTERFYKFLSGLGYNYARPFRGTRSIQRKANYATGIITDQSGTQWEDQLVSHPGLLDTALQTSFAAFCCPGDERLWTLHLPTSIRSALINPYFTFAGTGKQTELRYITVTEQNQDARIFADIHLLTSDSSQTFLQIEGVELVPLSPALPSNDSVLFSTFEYKPAHPDGDAVASIARYNHEDLELVIDSERISFYYFRRLLELVSDQDLARSLSHYRHLVNYAAHMIPPVIRGEHLYIPASAQDDTQEFIDDLVAKHHDDVSVRLLQSVGEHLPGTIQSDSNILEHMAKDSMLDKIYEEGFGLDQMNDFIAHMVCQIAHRYPRMNIFEIGAGTGGSTKRIIQALGSAFSSYTYTDISSSFFDKAQSSLNKFNDRMVFKTFDMNQTPESQGFVEESYDMVIGSNVLHATEDMERMMKNIRRLLKPGGYVIILEIVENNCLRVGLTMGSLPGWWLGAESGREYGPTLTLPQWDTLLSGCGFAGVDTTTPSIHQLIPLHVFCAQAVDNRIKMLRDPLTQRAGHPVATAPQLVIIGGKSFRTHKICGQMIDCLRFMFPRVHQLLSIDDLGEETLPEGSTVLSLTELDEPLFFANTLQRFHALKTVWRQSKHILWVTSGARAENPHSQMTNGIGRCMRSEHPNITLQMLDINPVSKDSATIIAEHLARLEMLSTWSTELQAGDYLWSLEPEVYVEDRKALIPRLYPRDASNKRYNTTRRIVTEDIDPQQANLNFAIEKDSREVQQPSPIRIPQGLRFSCDVRTIRIKYFLLSTLRVTDGTHLRICVGADTATQETHLAASPVSESPAVIPAALCIPLGQDDPSIVLAATSAYIVARSITQHVSDDDVLVLHDPAASVVDALLDILSTSSMSLFITTSKKNNARGWQYVDENSTERVVRDLLPFGTTTFLDLSAGSKTSKTIAKCLPHHCQTIDPARILCAELELLPSVRMDEVAAVLEVASAKRNSMIETATSIPMIQLGGISSYSTAIGERFAIVDCTEPSVQTVVRPIDDGTIFRADRTYFMVGLSGQLGQSLCKWMVAHGARFVVLTSRRPNVDSKFDRLMKQMGAVVKVLPMDVTSRESARRCYETVAETMPPIAGVANGAMLLRDDLFDKMSYEDFMTVTNPKVVGSLILEEIFFNTPLDFFIFFSSTTAVLGNSGQSNYAAANQFMNSLAAQRKQRGAVASSIDISSIIGIGYVERDDVVDEFTFTKMGYRPMSEQDLQYAFAEAVLIGKSDHQGEAELVAGISPLQLGDQASDGFFRDIKFSHYITERPEHRTTLGNSSHSLTVKAQLAEAKTKSSVSSIIKDSFLKRLRRMLAILPDDPINENIAFVEQGIDSLMAVEIRSWFFKELGVDFSVLKILGGSSIADLLEDATRMLPTSIVDISKLKDGQPEKETPSIKTVGIPAEVKESRKTEMETTSTGPSSDTIDTPEYATASSSVPSISLKPEDFVQKPENDGDVTESLGEIICPMSYGQRAFWFLNEYLADKTAFNMAVMVKITGSLQAVDLEEAVTMMANRHEIFRTRFAWAGEGDRREPIQAIASKSLLRLTKINIDSEAEAQTVLEVVRNETWELDSRETAKVLLLTLSDEAHFLIMSMHHIMADGYSFSVLLNDLHVAYMSKALPPLPVESQYRSFADQQKRLHEIGGTKEAIQYFQKTLSPAGAFEQPIQLLPFATSTARKTLTVYSQEEAKVQIDSDLKAKVRNLGRKHQSTSFHVYLSALQLLLFNLLPESTQDIVIGIADANRGNNNFLHSVGFFLNLLPLRFRRSAPNTKLASVIQNARDLAYGALSHSEILFDVLLRELNVPRSSEHTPLFQVFVDYKQVAQDLSSWGGCKLSDETWRNTSTGYDLVLDIHENVNTAATIHIRLQSTLYSKESTNMLLRSYVNVLEYMTEAAHDTVEGVPTWSPHDTQSILNTGRGASLDPQWSCTVSGRLDDVISTNGARPAIKDGNGVELTYEQMGKRIDSIANAILHSGTRPGAVVGVFQEPSADWICSMMAILRAGCVYLPLDLRISIPRLASIVRAAKPSVVLIDHTTADKVELIGAIRAIEVLVSDLQASEHTERSPNYANHDTPAVLLFTSGTTGEPKGIIMSNENLIANAEANSRIYRDEPDLVVLQQSAFSFDFSLDQTLAAFTNCGCLYVVPARSRGDPIAVSEIMLKEKVTYTSSTPSEYDMWLRYAVGTLRHCESWRYAFSGGEAMSRNLALQFQGLGLAKLRVFTGYGPAETTCFSTKIELNLQSLPDPLPAGFMLPGYSCIIVDEDLRPVPAGVPGEVLIGGPCVVLGYLNNSQATQQKFIPDTFFGTSSNVYRSGDRGRLLGDGTLYCDGRLEGDTQIKLRGFRIEVDEVEKAIIKHVEDALSQAIVTLRGVGEEGYLVAHIVFASGFPAEDRERIIQSIRYGLPLPAYMRPSAIVALDDVPRTPHLKVDRRMLQSLPVESQAGKGASSRPSEFLTETESQLCEMWLQVIPFNPGSLSSESDFFLVGGNSILLVKLQQLIRKTFSTAPQLVSLMGAPRLDTMSAVIEASRPTSAIDWESETQVPESIIHSQGTADLGQRGETDAITVLLTGSRGYLGRHLLPYLVNDPRVSRVYCLVRGSLSDEYNKNPKIEVIEADISRFALGMPETTYATLASETDTIIHCAANRSLWDRYEVLRPDNFDSVKELARFAATAQQTVSFHMLSSGALTSYDQNSSHPPQNGSDGYLSTKWAAEKFLQRFASTLQIPVYIHRPVPLSLSSQAACSDTGAVGVLDRFVAIAADIGLRPAFSGITGTVHLRPVDSIVQVICETVFDSIKNDGRADDNNNDGDPFNVLHHDGTIRIAVNQLEERFSHDDSVRLLATFPLLDWMGKAKRTGFEYVVTSWELFMDSDNEVVSRR